MAELRLLLSTGRVCDQMPERQVDVTRTAGVPHNPVRARPTLCPPCPWGAFIWGKPSLFSHIPRRTLPLRKGTPALGVPQNRTGTAPQGPATPCSQEHLTLRHHLRAGPVRAVPLGDTSHPLAVALQPPCRGQGWIKPKASEQNHPSTKGLSSPSALPSLSAPSLPPVSWPGLS